MFLFIKEVVLSKNPKFKVGDKVQGFLGKYWNLILNSHL